MIPFDWVEPASLKEAVSLLDADDSTVRPISGGTALMLMMKPGFFVPSRLVSLAKIEADYSSIRAGGDGSLRVGAMTSLAELERSAAAIVNFPVMKGALQTLSNIRVRNVARVGGALAHGDPHMDLPPLFATLGARVVLGAASERVTRLAQTESLLTGAIVNDGLLKRVSESAAAEARFVSDAHGSAAYKRELLRVYLPRTIKEALS